MKIEFTGRQTEIADGVRRLAEQKLAKLTRLLPKLTRAHVVLVADKHRRVAEVSVHSRSLDLTAVAVSPHPRLSVAAVAAPPAPSPRTGVFRHGKIMRLPVTSRAAHGSTHEGLILRIMSIRASNHASARQR